MNALIPREILKEIFIFALDTTQPTTARECFINVCVICQHWRVVCYSARQSMIDMFGFDFISPIIFTRIDRFLHLTWRWYELSEDGCDLIHLMTGQRYEFSRCYQTSNYLGSMMYWHSFEVYYRDLDSLPCTYDFSGMKNFSIDQVLEATETSIGLVLNALCSFNGKCAECYILLSPFVSGQTVMIKESDILCSELGHNKWGITMMYDNPIFTYSHVLFNEGGKANHIKLTTLSQQTIQSKSDGPGYLMIDENNIVHRQTDSFLGKIIGRNICSFFEEYGKLHIIYSD